MVYFRRIDHTHMAYRDKNIVYFYFAGQKPYNIVTYKNAGEAIQYLRTVGFTIADFILY